MAIGLPGGQGINPLVGLASTGAQNPAQLAQLLAQAGIPVEQFLQGLSSMSGTPVGSAGGVPPASLGQLISGGAGSDSLAGGGGGLPNLTPAPQIPVTQEQLPPPGVPGVPPAGAPGGAAPGGPDTTGGPFGKIANALRDVKPEAPIQPPQPQLLGSPSVQSPQAFRGPGIQQILQMLIQSQGGGGGVPQSLGSLIGGR